MENKTRNRVIILGLLIIALTAAVICWGRINKQSSQEILLATDIDFSSPTVNDAKQKQVKEGTYEGERNTNADGLQVLEVNKDIDTEKFPIYSFNSVVTFEKNGNSDLWIENLKENKYSIQVVISNPNNDEVIYMSPILDPGTYIESQKLDSVNLETTNGQEIVFYLYNKEGTEYTLYGVGGSMTIMFKNK